MSPLTKNVKEFSKKTLGEWASRQKKYRKSNRTWQKNKRGDSKVEPNDSPEIPDRGETSDIPGLPSGPGLKETFIKRYNKAEIRPEEQSQKTKSCRESLWEEIQLRG